MINGIMHQMMKQQQRVTTHWKNGSPVVKPLHGIVHSPCWDRGLALSTWRKWVKGFHSIKVSQNWYWCNQMIIHNQDYHPQEDITLSTVLFCCYNIPCSMHCGLTTGRRLVGGGC